MIDPTTRPGVSQNLELLAGYVDALSAFDPSAAAGAVEASGSSEQTVALPELIAQLQARNPELIAFTRIFEAGITTNTDAAAPLAGVPFAVKDLFDVRGLTTTAGAAMRVDAPVATRDAVVVQRLKQAGAVLVGTTNMDEFAYGFATVNAHFGTTRNPHDVQRLAGGSSGGSAAAVAAGLVPFALGSDTNGSIRVPAALCGIYGLRSTHGQVPLDGVFPFVDALDVAGPFARSLDVLQAVHEVMADATLGQVDVGGLRIARLGGWFDANLDPDLRAGLDAIGAALDAGPTLELPQAKHSRMAAFVMTAIEGAYLHRDALRTQPDAFDPAVRDRLLAGMLQPAQVLLEVQRFAAWFREAMAKLWEQVDVLIAPAVPCVAPRIDQATIEIDGQPVSARANLGIFTQPLGLAGCPVLAAPLWRPGQLPLGVQLIAAPGREDRLFAVARALEERGLTGAHAPPGVTA
ncbi:aspartyl-tRNA(Asn)/glutamyl-tRNA(Gln) amidotransferase subunit A [Pseudoxanthomonas sp. GM95]|uniref:AtzE family amidohydrolase n=1 Tax=Pseudoxanthomonas sp. GM95 TaxID=1881043 RepID=UPI0008B18E3F|nr:AtzE family amidohydrolase [Pseudoxanthomonas sp. GM95]SEK96558.1 aspartyl-tRNA(Asn)/glutamyl-tRNA(Gln) amidotransferase subunit A [Pseudoxanthomonas sp. GM95]